MATVLENLRTARAAAAAQLAAHGGTPDTLGDGRSVNWGVLTQRITDLDALIAREEGPFEIVSVGR